MNKDYISTSALYGPYLAHHGILGQKWGVRRYQNPDGTLTEEGKRRYYTEGSYGSKILSDAGKEYNREHSKKVQQYADAVNYNVRHTNPAFNKKFQEYKDLNKKNNLNYLTERKKWANQFDIL